MKAAVIDSLARGQRFADFADPVVGGGEILVKVTAAGLHPMVRMLASGEHYGSQGSLPMIPGIDGTGRLPDGRAVNFGGVRPRTGRWRSGRRRGLCCRCPRGLSLHSAVVSGTSLTQTTMSIDDTDLPGCYLSGAV